MDQNQIRNIYDLLQKGQYLVAIKLATNQIDRIKTKYRQSNLHDNNEYVLLLIGLRGLSYLRIGNLIQAENDINKIMQIKPLNEEIIIVLWHYYIIHGNFITNHKRLRELADYFQDASDVNILSEQFEIDILSLYYYLKEFNIMKVLCNKYYKKYKKSYFLALNILISFSIFQNQVKENKIKNHENCEDVLLLLLIDKYLKENIINLELKNNLKLFDRRIITTINLIKLFVLRKNKNWDLYKETLKNLSEMKSILYPCIDDEKLLYLNNYFILEEAENYLLNNGDKIIIYKITLIELIKNFDINIEIDWDNLRTIKLYIIRLINETFNLEQNSFLRDIGDNRMNTSLKKQNSQSSQITNCSSFQTQSTISSFSGSFQNNSSDLNLTLLDKIFNIININEDDEDFYEGKNKFSLFLITDIKGKILLIELLIELLIYIDNNQFNVHIDSLNENLLLNINNEIINLINSNDITIVIDLRISLSNYFKNKSNNINDHLICTIFNDLNYLFDNHMLEETLNWDYYSSRIFILTMFNQYKVTMQDLNMEFLNKMNFNSKEIIQILKNVLNNKFINIFMNNKDLRSKYIYFLVSLSLYCLSIPIDNNSQDEFNYNSIFFFILIFVNNYLIDHNIDYIVSHLISEFLPIIGSFSISHNIRNNILNIKRSQIATLNLYGNMLEILSCPYFNVIHKTLKNDNILQFNNINQLYTFKDINIEESEEFNFNNVKTILNSYFDIYNELKETCIESLRENTYSLDNLLNSSKLIDEISNDNIIQLLFGIDFLNNIFSLLLLSLSKKYNNTNNIFLLFKSYKSIIQSFINQDNIICYTDKNIKQDLSPIIDFAIPIYNVEYQFKKSSNSINPTNYFKYHRYLDLLNQFPKFNPKFNTEIFKYVNEIPKIKFIMTQKLKIWLTILLFIDDLFIQNENFYLEQFNEKIYLFKNQILSDKHSHLISHFDIELFKKVIMPLLQHLFEISSIYLKHNNDQRLIKQQITNIIDLIDSSVCHLIDENIIQNLKNITTNHEKHIPNYNSLQILLENINSIIFGPSLILTFIQTWIYHNFSKKVITNSYKSLSNSHSKIIQNIYNHLKNFLVNFHGTLEIIHYQKLSELFNHLSQLPLNNNKSNIEINQLKNSQYLTINNISDILLYIINSIKYNK